MKRILFIIDPLSSLIAYKDTTVFMMQHVKKENHQVFFCEPKDLYYSEGSVKVCFKEVMDPINSLEDVGLSRSSALLEFDYVFMRKDPPVDDKYIKTTYMLEMVKDNVLVVNNPTALRAFNEKLSTLRFDKIIPNTIVCNGGDKDTIKEWTSNFKDGVVIKPLNLCGGEGIQKFDGRNFSSLDLVSNETYILQEFINKVYDGDKRIIILNGEPIGAILRKAKEGGFICNFHSGGTPHKTEISKEDLIICSEIKNFLIENHIYLAGIDIIGGFLTEINITSPTCLQEINRANETKLEKNVLDFIIQKIN